MFSLLLFAVGAAVCLSSPPFPLFSFVFVFAQSINRAPPARSFLPAAGRRTDTGVLVQEIDHFCPWTGTTIAKKNLFTFYVFVVSLFVQIAVLVISLISVVRQGPAGAGAWANAKGHGPHHGHN